MKIIRYVIVAAVAFAVTATGIQAAAAAPRGTGQVVRRALEVRGPEAVGQARPGVRTDDGAKSVSVAAGGVTHTIAATDRRNSEVRRLADGGQVITVLRHGDSIRYDVTLAPGWTLQKAGAGLLITKPGTDLVGTVAAPWAIDAAGRSLHTWYEATPGNRLVQRVDTAGASYPITADPRLTFGRGIYLNLSGVEVQGMLAFLIAGGGAAAYLSCKGLAKLPSEVKKVVELLCKVPAVAAAATIKNVLNALKSLGEINAYACYQKRIVPNQGNWKIVDGKNCRG